MTKRVVVTGGAGQIAYSLLFRIAKGELLGYEQPIHLHILELDDSLSMLKGVLMELEDCCYPLVRSVKIGSDPNEIFEGADYAFLVGAKPRGPGMERKDLLMENGKIFIGQGKALNKVASKNVKVLVVGNPCNTNCLITMHHAPDISRKNFFAMTRLDQNRAQYQLAKKAHLFVGDVENVTIWGNHSATQVPDFLNAKIRSKPAMEVIKDHEWLKNDFFKDVQQRGSAIINARGKSSAASAANAAIDSVYSFLHSTPPGHWFSCGVSSDKNPYGIKNGLIFSFPIKSNGEDHYQIVDGLKWDGFLEEKIRISEKELLEERDMVASML